MRPRRGLLSRLDGPLPALVRPLDRLAERWASLRPRTRVAAILVALALAAGVTEVRVLAAEARWGGAGVRVLVAAENLPVGATPAVRPAVFPPMAVPPGALASVAPDAVLALALPEGSVLTQAHVDPAGPAAGLDEALRVVPLPVERGWGIAPGGWVDVWVLGDSGEPGARVASGRPVLELSTNDAGRQTALVALAEADVAAATAGVTLGRILLTHAPGPDGAEPAG